MMGKTYTKRNSDVNPAKQQTQREDKRNRPADGLDTLGFAGWGPYGVSVQQFKRKGNK